jgi:hypothetical protein
MTPAPGILRKRVVEVSREGAEDGIRTRCVGEERGELVECKEKDREGWTDRKTSSDLPLIYILDSLPLAGGYGVPRGPV